MGSIRGAPGFSLVDLLVALVLTGILTSLAIPSFTRYTDRIRLRAALDGITVELYRARALAAREGAPMQLRFQPAKRNVCLASYTLASTRPERILKVVRIEDDTPGVCLMVNVGSPMRVTARGLLLGASRTIRATRGTQRDSATVSIAGRVYRSY